MMMRLLTTTLLAAMGLLAGCGPVSRITSGPLRVHPGNPRYFADAEGRAVYLTGSHVWNNMQDWGTVWPPEPLDFNAHLDLLTGWHHNFTRGWAHEQAKSDAGYPGDFFFTPLPFERTGPGLALDGKPRFDVTRFDQAYFDRLRSRATTAGRRGMYISVMLFQGWSIEDKKRKVGNPWLNHPFNAANNVNGIDGDPNRDNLGQETHALIVPAVTAVQESYVRKVIDTLNDLDNILWEISNESWDGSVDWQYHMIRFIKQYEAGKPKQHLVWMSGFMVPNASLFAGPADCVSPCRKDGTNYRGDPPATKGDKIVILDTDHIWGIGGNYQWAWKSFLRGYHPIFMDPMYGLIDKPDLDRNAPQWVALRHALGDTRRFADRMNLARATPQDELSSTRYCLADPGREYLVFQPGSGSFTLRVSQGRYRCAWFNPRNRELLEANPVVAEGGVQTFTPVFEGDAVLWLRAG